MNFELNFTKRLLYFFDKILYYSNPIRIIYYLFFKLDDIKIIAIIMLIRIFFIEYTVVPSCSMYPTLYTGDFVLTNKAAFRYAKRTMFFGGYLPFLDKGIKFKSVKAGDVVAFNLPNDHWTIYCKRVIATGGDRVQKKQGKTYVNDVSFKYELIDETVWFDDAGLYINGYIYKVTMHNGVEYNIFRETLLNEYVSAEDTNENSPEYKIPEGHLFMQGDNNLHSRDSFDTEFMGFVPEECVISRPFFVISNTNSRKSEAEPGIINYLLELIPRIVYGIYTINFDRFFKNVK